MSTTVSVLVPRALLPAEVTFLETLAPGLISVYSWSTAPAEDTPMRALRSVRPDGDGAIVALGGRASTGELLLFLGEGIADCLGGVVVTGSDSLDEAIAALRSRPQPSADGLGPWFQAVARQWTADGDDDDVEATWARDWLSRGGGDTLESPASLLTAADRERTHHLVIDDDTTGSVAVTREEATLVEATQEALLERLQAEDGDADILDADFLAALQQAGGTAGLLARITPLFADGDDGTWPDLAVVAR